MRQVHVRICYLREYVKRLAIRIAAEHRASCLLRAAATHFIYG